MALKDWKYVKALSTPNFKNYKNANGVFILVSKQIATNKWGVGTGKYETTISRSYKIKGNKVDAIKFAKTYMRRH